jgi:tetratricopeptide (TPR) repeat protein
LRRLLWLRLLLLALSTLAASLTNGEVDPRSARLSSAITRCTRFAELVSCAEALSIKPGDPELLVSEGDALVQTGRPGEAIGVYRNALRQAARPDVVYPKITSAQSQRQSLLHTCFDRDGDLAERACESAWLPGAPDEVAVFKRRGVLLQAGGHSAAALDAYLAAARLAPADRTVARAVVSLNQRIGRKDAPTSTAVGTALMTLGRRAEAVAAFRSALRTDPASTLAKERLRMAERQAPVLQGPMASDVPGIAAVDSAPAVATYSNAAEETRSN